MTTNHPLQRRYVVASKLYLEAVALFKKSRDGDINNLTKLFDSLIRTHKALCMPQFFISEVQSAFQSHINLIGTDKLDIDAFIEDQRAELVLPADVPESELRQYSEALTLYLDHLHVVHAALLNDTAVLESHYNTILSTYNALGPCHQSNMYAPFPPIKRLDRHTRGYISGMHTLIGSYV